MEKQWQMEWIKLLWLVVALSTYNSSNKMLPLSTWDFPQSTNILLGSFTRHVILTFRVELYINHSSALQHCIIYIDTRLFLYDYYLKTFNLTVLIYISMANYKQTGVCLNTWKVLKKEVRVKTKFKF